VNVAAQRRDPDSLLSTIRHMVHTFKAQPALADGKLFWVEDAPLNTVVFWRESAEQALLAFHNLANAPMSVTTAQFAGRSVTDVLSDEQFVLEAAVNLPAYGYKWLRLD
jgi:glycosidase